ncbi:hypothetical protein [Methanohalophilus sp.]
MPRAACKNPNRMPVYAGSSKPYLISREKERKWIALKVSDTNRKRGFLISKKIEEYDERSFTIVELFFTELSVLILSSCCSFFLLLEGLIFLEIPNQVILSFVL